MQSVSSVKVESLDKEHEDCVEAINRVLKDRSVESLAALLANYQVHFSHEEDLLDEHVYADELGAGKDDETGFSVPLQARKSHFDDHKRMIQNIQRELRRSSQDNYVISDSFIKSIMTDFEGHAEIYDAAYVDPLVESLRQSA